MLLEPKKTMTNDWDEHGRLPIFGKETPYFFLRKPGVTPVKSPNGLGQLKFTWCTP